MLTLFIILALLLQIAIVLSVYFRRNGRQANSFFMLLVLTLAAWSFTNYIAISIHQNISTIYVIRIVLLFVVIQNILFYFFTKTFPDKKILKLSTHDSLLTILSLIVLVVTQLPIVFKTVIIQNGEANPVVAPGIMLFILLAIYTTCAGFWKLISQYNKSKGQVRSQLLVILFATFIILLVVPITNFVITLTLHTTSFVKFSPFYTLAFGSLITYAIFTQKLFDIRAAVARSVGYVLVLVTISLAYGAVLFGIVNVLLPGQTHQFLRDIVSIILVAPLLLSFQSLKSNFDRFTNKIFYRDNYEIQDVLDQLGDSVVNEIDLYKLLDNTRTILNRALKSKFIEYVLIKDDKPFLEARNRWGSKIDSNKITHLISRQHKELLVVDELVEGDTFKDELVKSDVALSLRLKVKKQLIGYILIGYKNSGDIFNSKDENLLLIAANELSIAIENALRFEQIENFNLTLQYKVEHATRQLRKANEKLKELDDSKDDFISMASHQLRTPLSVIKGYVGMVVNGEAGKINDNQYKFLKQAQDSSESMVRLVTELLNVSRITTGKFVIEAAPMNLSKLIDYEVDQLKNMAESKNIKLTFHKPNDFPEMLLDEEKTKQVIINFIDNAIHYSRSQNGMIDVYLTNENDIEFKVVDNGIGVPESAKKELFTKFYRAKNAKDARPDGSGVGIYLAKVVITEQGGELIFDSKEGEGSTFGFKFKKDKIISES